MLVLLLCTALFTQREIGSIPTFASGKLVAKFGCASASVYHVANRLPLEKTTLPPPYKSAAGNHIFPTAISYTPCPLPCRGELRFCQVLLFDKTLGERCIHCIIQMPFLPLNILAAALYLELPDFHCERFNTFLVLTGDRAYFADRVVYVCYFGRHCFHVAFDVSGKRI